MMSKTVPGKNVLSFALLLLPRLAEGASRPVLSKWIEKLRLSTLALVSDGKQHVDQ